MTGSTSGGYDQFETSSEAIEQELRPAVCERRQTDLRQIIVYIMVVVVVIFVIVAVVFWSYSLSSQIFEICAKSPI